MHTLIKLLSVIAIIFAIPISASAQIWPHIKTFGFDYGGGTTPTAELQWLAQNHDAVIGMQDYSLQKINETQYDVMKAANANVKLFAYMYHTAFTTTAMQEFCEDWATDNSLNVEDLYIHYYYDTPVKLRTSVTRTTGTGTPSDRICTSDGTLVSVGASSNYYLSLGYGGGTAATLADARVYQKWNSGWEPKGNHMHSTYYGAYKAWVLYQVQVATGKNLDGIFIDTYDGPVLTDYNPSMHYLIEIRAAGQNGSDTIARTYYATEMAEMVGQLRTDMRSELSDSDFIITLNASEFGYMYNTSKVALGDQFGATKLDSVAIEYLATPSKAGYWTIYNYAKTFLDDVHADDLASVFAQTDTAWYDYGAYPKPPIGGKQHMIAGFYLFNDPNIYFGVHYGSGANYGRRNESGAYETSDAHFSISHWDEMMEYDIGTPVVRTGTDFQGNSNTDKMYIVEQVHGTRYVLARNYTNGKVIVRYEDSNNNTAEDLGTDPRSYDLGGTYRRLQEDGSLGSPVTTITLGKSEGAIMISNAVKQMYTIGGALAVPVDSE